MSILTKNQLEDIFYQLTVGTFGFTDQQTVRLTWPTYGEPSWDITQDVFFVLVAYDDSPMTRQVMREYSEYDASTANENLVYTAPIRVSWNIYGPNSFANADYLWSQLFTSSTATTLASNNLALITDVPRPTRSPELFNSQWWERSTFYARFNQLVTQTGQVPYLTSAPVTLTQE